MRTGSKTIGSKTIGAKLHRDPRLLPLALTLALLGACATNLVLVWSWL